MIPSIQRDHGAQTQRPGDREIHINPDPDRQLAQTGRKTAYCGYDSTNRTVRARGTTPDELALVRKSATCVVCLAMSESRAR